MPVCRTLYRARQLFVAACLPLSAGLLASPGGAASDGLKAATEIIIRQNGGRTDLLGLLSQILTSFDKNRNGLDRDDIDAAKAIEEAGWRARAAGAILIYDLDGNLIVTREELERYYRYAMNHNNDPSQESYQYGLQSFLGRILENDANQNGSLEGTEITAGVNTGRQPEREIFRNRLNFADELLKSDLNGDGRITEQEALQILASFAGEIKLPERRSPSQTIGSTTSGKCPDLRPNPDSPLLLLSTIDGSAIPTVTVVGQEGRTSATTIDIAKGGPSFSLVLVSYEPMIWIFTGDTERLIKANIAVEQPASPNVAAGAVGLQKEKVEFFQAKGCIAAFENAYDSRATQSIRAFESALGRRAKMAMGLGSATGVVVTDQAVLQKTAEPFDEVAARLQGLTAFDNTFGMDVKNWYPAGVKPLKPADVVSESHVESYEVLPGRMGMIQLLSNGSIEVGPDRKYYVTRQITLPAGMIDPGRIDLRLKPGVPPPKGNPGQSCIFDSTGKTLVAGRGTCITGGDLSIIESP